MRKREIRAVGTGRGAGPGLVAVVVAGTVALAACTPDPNQDHYTDRLPGDYKPRTTEPESVFGEGGLNLFGGGGGREGEGGGGGPGIGVNSFLWRASLDTISFLPVNSADPFGGVIITDWHSPPEAPRERFKMNVYILGRSLRADGVRVALFRQVQDDVGVWRDASVPEVAGVQIEDAILTKARQLRFETLQQ